MGQGILMGRGRLIAATAMLLICGACSQEEILEGERLGLRAFDGTPEVQKFAETLEKVCIDTVESGSMTKDLAILIGPDQGWLTTNQFLDKLDENLKAAMALETA